MDSSPPTLYKYFGPDRTDVLKNCLIRYSPLGAFNDPFEGQPDVTSLTTEADARATFKTLLPQQTKSAFDQLPIEVRSKLPYEVWQRLVEQQMKSAEPELIRTMLGLTPNLRSLMSQKLDQFLGAFCLSEVPDSLLMWSHYGASHAGFVLGFDARHSYFHEEKGPEDEFRHLRRVLYREARPSATLAEFDGVDFFLVKSGHWSYEREWRIFRPLQEASVVRLGDPLDVHLFSFPPSALETVILGARMTDTAVTSVAEYVRENRSLGHVRILRARPDNSHFLLRIGDESI